MLIGYIFQEKGVGRHGFASLCALLSFYYFLKIVYANAPTANINERSNYRPHHVAEKTVGTDFKVPGGRRGLMPLGGCYVAQRGLDIGMRLTESPKIFII